MLKPTNLTMTNVHQIMIINYCQVLIYVNMVTENA